MTTEHDTHLSPDAPNPSALDPAAYHLIIGPALKVAADIAAKRGDPTLHADMPAMLALVDIVTRLADLYTETYPDSGVDADMLASAPASTCVMVLQEAGLDPHAIEQCMQALEAAYQKMYEQDVISAARPYIAMAWAHLTDAQNEQARDCLIQATRTIIAAIESWQQQVH